MCGRYTLKTSPAKILQQLANFPVSSGQTFLSRIQPRYNIAPNQRVLVIRGASLEGESQYAAIKSVEFAEMHWGRPVANRQLVINTRLENLEEKACAQTPPKLTIRPCLIIADGYYEWKNKAGSRIPYYLHRKDHHLLLFSGTWQTVSDPKTTTRDCCTILTCPASRSLDHIHNRMPLFTDPMNGMDWLLDSSALQRCRAHLKSCSIDILQTHSVHTRVNHVDFEGPSCIERAAFHRQNLLF